MRVLLFVIVTVPEPVTAFLISQFAVAVSSNPVEPPFRLIALFYAVPLVTFSIPPLTDVAAE